MFQLFLSPAYRRTLETGVSVSDVMMMIMTLLIELNDFLDQTDF